MLFVASEPLDAIGTALHCLRRIFKPFWSIIGKPHKAVSADPAENGADG